MKQINTKNTPAAREFNRHNDRFMCVDLSRNGVTFESNCNALAIGPYPKRRLQYNGNSIIQHVATPTNEMPSGVARFHDINLIQSGACESAWRMLGPNLQNHRKLRLLAYAAFFAFCACSAVRDVLSEHLFKRKQFSAHPIFALFVYSFVTQLISLTILWLRRRSDSPWLINSHGLGWRIVALNVFTLLSFGAYFWAISTALGAALSSFIEYGTTPIVTAIAGAAILGERLNGRYFLVSAACVLGICLFGYQRISVSATSPDWYFGLWLAIISSACGAVYRIINKSLLNRGMTIEAVLFVRLTGLTIVSGILLAMNPTLFHVDMLLPVAAIGVLGFSFPLLISLFILQRLYLRSFALLLFLSPVLTYALSTVGGYNRFESLDVVAAVIIFSAIVFNEWQGEPKVRSHDAGAASISVD